MRIIKGKGVVPEIAIGRFFMMDKKDIGDELSEQTEKVSDKTAELERFHSAVQTASDEFEKLSEIARERAGESEAEIFETHRLMP